MHRSRLYDLPAYELSLMAVFVGLLARYECVTWGIIQGGAPLDWSIMHSWRDWCDTDSCNKLTNSNVELHAWISKQYMVGRSMVEVYKN